MKTISVLIGNTDNKLTQQKWHEFVNETSSTILSYSTDIHFFGAPSGYAQFQNACWVFSLETNEIRTEEGLKAFLNGLKLRFGQDSIAYLAGETQFI